MPIPSQSGKTTLEHLQDLPKIDYVNTLFDLEKSALYKINEAGFRFDFLWRPLFGANRIFVFFSGDALRKKNDPPVFQRWSWARNFPGHCLYFSDPALFLSSEIGLAWYAGTAKFDPLDFISKIILQIASQAGVKSDRIISYGSSGGGFAAMRLAVKMSEISVVSINPQTNITKYEFKSVDRYLNLCFDGRDRKAALLDFPERLSLLEHKKHLKNCRVIYIQNTEDLHHFNEHYIPFCNALDVDAHEDDSLGNFRRLLFSHEGGHGKAETQDVFSKAMNIIINYDKK